MAKKKEELIPCSNCGCSRYKKCGCRKADPQSNSSKRDRSSHSVAKKY